MHGLVKLKVLDGFPQSSLDRDQFIQTLGVVFPGQTKTVFGFILGDELLNHFVDVVDSRDFKQLFKPVFKIDDFLLYFIGIEGHVCQGIGR